MLLQTQTTSILTIAIVCITGLIMIAMRSITECCRDKVAPRKLRRRWTNSLERKREFWAGFLHHRFTEDDIPGRMLGQCKSTHMNYTYNIVRNRLRRSSTSICLWLTWQHFPTSNTLSFVDSSGNVWSSSRNPISFRSMWRERNDSRASIETCYFDCSSSTTTAQPYQGTYGKYRVYAVQCQQ